ncbi:recombinase family protein [Brevundimonas sp. GCM10030266]|uniref:recombinase family protein n=1 Tax=Brevundimonas sp. GCM10030266 TaxID=3273386 RepID=UPI00361490D7
MPSVIPGAVYAAQYIRMSTERQEYSLDFQKTANAAYAASRGVVLVKTYEDAGVSGLSLLKRDGLKALLADVLSGKAGFTQVLVYDVSRWGRFQNPDQAAYYEFMCAQAGVSVIYCAESFENDGSPTSGLLKHIKRTMAAEYSRDLSERVTRAQRGLLAEGYWMGGRVPLGLKRVFARADGAAIDAPEKSFVRKQHGVRTKLVLGPLPEVELVRRIFDLYLRRDATYVGVARMLAADPSIDPLLGNWTVERVRYVISNEVYIGRLMGARRKCPVGVKSGGRVPREQWLVVEDVVPPIVSKAVFQAAQRKRLLAKMHVTRAQALADVSRLADEHGSISQKIIKRHGKWSIRVYYRLLGSMAQIRDLIGVPLPSKYANFYQFKGDVCRHGGSVPSFSMAELRDHLQQALKKHGRLSRAILDSCGPPCAFTFVKRYGSLAAAYRDVGYIPDVDQAMRLRPGF